MNPDRKNNDSEKLPDWLEALKRGIAGWTRGLVDKIFGEDPKKAALKTENHQLKESGAAREIENLRTLKELADAQQRAAGFKKENGILVEELAEDERNFAAQSVEMLHLLQKNNGFEAELRAMEKAVRGLIHDSRMMLGGQMGIMEMLEVRKGSTETEIGILVKEVLEKRTQESLRKNRLGSALCITLLGSFKKRFEIIQGSFEIDPAPLNLLRILEIIEAATHETNRALNISVKKDGTSKEIDFGKNADEYEIQGDTELVSAIFLNLIKNAFEAAEQNKSQDRTVSVEIEDQDDSHIITIKNSGVIPKEIRGKFLKECVTFGKKNGSGLGSHIARSFIEAHGGEIFFNVDDVANITSIFVKLPKDPLKVLEARKKTSTNRNEP